MATRALALLVAAVGIALVVLDVVLIEFFGPFIVIPIAVLPLALVGALLIARVPRNPVGWLLSLSGLFFGIMFAGGAYGWMALVGRPGTLPGGEIAATFGSVAFAPAIGLAVLMLLFFPSGRGLGGRWTWVERTLVAVIVLIGWLNFVKDVPIGVALPLDQGTASALFIKNPLALHGTAGSIVAAIAGITDATTIPLVLAGPLSLFVRYRRASSIEREQIKWLAYSGTLSLTLIVMSNFVPGEMSNWLWGAGVSTLGALPIAIAVAIFRYRLYDIDVLIRRTIIYAAVSAVLIAAYLGAIVLSEAILARFIDGSSVAVAISTLAVVALFQPVRVGIRSAVDRRFYRSTYDAERTLDAFSSRLRDELDLAAVERELVVAVNATIQPVHASVWLRERSR